MLLQDRDLLTLVEQPLGTVASGLSVAKVDAQHLVVRRERVLGTLARKLFLLQLRLVRVVRNGAHGGDALLRR